MTSSFHKDIPPPTPGRRVRSMDYPNGDDGNRRRYRTLPMGARFYQHMNTLLPALDPKAFVIAASTSDMDYVSSTIRDVMDMRQLFEKLVRILKGLVGSSYNVHKGCVDDMAYERGALMISPPPGEDLNSIIHKLRTDTDHYAADQILKDVCRAMQRVLAEHALTTHVPLSQAYSHAFDTIENTTSRTKGWPDSNDMYALKGLARRMITQEGADPARERVGMMIGDCRRGLKKVYYSLSQFDQAETTWHELQMAVHRAVSMGFATGAEDFDEANRAKRAAVVTDLIKLGLDDRSMLSILGGGVVRRAFHTAMAVLQFEENWQLFSDHVRVAKLRHEIFDVLSGTHVLFDPAIPPDSRLSMEGYTDDILTMEDISDPRPSKELQYEKRKRSYDTSKQQK